MPYRDWAALLGAALGLGRKVVAVDLAEDEAAYGAWALQPLKGPRSFCTMVRLAASGHGRKARGHHFGCPGAAEVFRFREPGPDDVPGERLYGFGLYANPALAARIHVAMPRLPEACAGVAVLPLAECERDPRVVMLLVDAYQAMRLVQAWAYHHGPLEHGFQIGNRGVCAESVARPLCTGQPNLSPLCANTRYAQRWADRELGFGVPFDVLESLCDGLLQTIPAVEPDARRKAIEARLAEAGLDVTVPAGHTYYKQS